MSKTLDEIQAILTEAYGEPSPASAYCECCKFFIPINWIQWDYAGESRMCFVCRDGYDV